MSASDSTAQAHHAVQLFHALATLDPEASYMEAYEQIRFLLDADEPYEDLAGVLTDFAIMMCNSFAQKEGVTLLEAIALIASGLEDSVEAELAHELFPQLEAAYTEGFKQDPLKALILVARMLYEAVSTGRLVLQVEDLKEVPLTRVLGWQAGFVPYLNSKAFAAADWLTLVTSQHLSQAEKKAYLNGRVTDGLDAPFDVPLGCLSIGVSLLNILAQGINVDALDALDHLRRRFGVGLL